MYKYYIIHWKKADETGVFLFYSGLSYITYLQYRRRNCVWCWCYKRLSHKLAEETFINYLPIICDNKWDKTISLEEFAINYFNTIYNNNEQIIASYYI